MIEESAMQDHGTPVAHVVKLAIELAETAGLLKYLIASVGIRGNANPFR
jgi:hypothetical protein